MSDRDVHFVVCLACGTAMEFSDSDVRKREEARDPEFGDTCAVLVTYVPCKSCGAEIVLGVPHFKEPKR